MKAKNKYLNLLNNSFTLFVANFGSQILSFFLVPLYTYTLTTNEYGISDIFTTTISIVVPIITLSISEATLRFLIDEEAKKKSILSISIALSLFGDFLILLFMPMIANYANINEYVFLLWLTILFNSLYLVTSYYCRGNGDIKKYAIGGLLSTVSSLLCNLLLLIKLKMGINGYLISYVVSYLIPTVYYVISLKLWKHLDRIDKKLLKTMVCYSIPMIPGAIAWMAMASFDKYILICYWGASYNGLYTAAQKIPALINVINSIFMQSWQLSAVAEMNSTGKEEFYSNVFNVLAAILLMLTSCATLVIKPFYNVWLEQHYFEAWKYTTILMVANTFSCFSNFVGTNYFAMKRTTGNMKTLLVGGLVNIVLNLIFVPKFGIYAASVTTLISFLFTWLYRVYDTKDFIKIKVDTKKIIEMLIIICIQYISLYLKNGLVIQTICIMCVMFIYRYEFVNIIKMIKESILKRNADENNK